MINLYLHSPSLALYMFERIIQWWTSRIPNKLNLFLFKIFEALEHISRYFLGICFDDFRLTSVFKHVLVPVSNQLGSRLANLSQHVRLGAP